MRMFLCIHCFPSFCWCYILGHLQQVLWPGSEGGYECRRSRPATARWRSHQGGEGVDTCDRFRGLLCPDCLLNQRLLQCFLFQITEKTRVALEKSVSQKVAAAMPVRAADKLAPAQYIRYEVCLEVLISFQTWFKLGVLIFFSLSSFTIMNALFGIMSLILFMENREQNYLKYSLKGVTYSAFIFFSPWRNQVACWIWYKPNYL